MTQLKSRQNSADELHMGTQNTEWKFLVTTAFLVATVAVPTLASLISSDGVDQPTMVLRANEQKTREPASLPKLGLAKKPVVIEDAGKELGNLMTDASINFDFKCDKLKETEFTVQGSYVQLKGHDCGKGEDMPKLSITNKTNGFTASVFLMSGKLYQTDLIQLKEGENQIHIYYQYPTGKSEEHILNVKASAI